MRRNIKSLFISLTIGMAIFCSSCVDDLKFGDSFLEKAPGVDVTLDSVFAKAENARYFLWDTYSKLYYGLPVYWNSVDNKMNMGMFETLSDTWHSHLSWDGVNRSYYNGTYNANREDTSDDTKFGFSKENTWEAIRKAWLFIENIDRVPDMQQSEKERLKAEAKVIVASRYFDMFRHFGGLPIIDKAYDFSLDESYYQTPRATVEQTVEFMNSLLDDASGVLPWALDEGEISNWDGRFTKAAAMGLKCKILLFAASPLFNDTEPYSKESPQDAVTNLSVWYGAYKSEIWEQTLKACEDFFREVSTQGRYGLVQPTEATPSAYRDAFRKAYYTRGSGGDNPELLISTRVRYTYGDDYQWDYYFPQSVMNGAFTPTLEYVDMFPLSDGTPFDWNNPDHVDVIFSDRDPRLYETVLVNNASYQGRQVELWVGGREAQQGPRTEQGQFATGFGLYKFILDFSSARNRPTLWPYLRIAEIHLIYAEALMMAGRTDEAINEVDKVRARVGLNGLRDSNPSVDYSNQTLLLEAILNERACELGLEDVRFFDLIRHKRAQDFSKVLHGLRIYRLDENGNVVNDSWSDKPANDRGPRPTEFRYEKFQLENSSRAWWTNFNSKWYLSAFPTLEVNKDYGLTQNPGW
ncbi:RagB/SusD family nutrient uptake outer membrane protein [Proteiniphilum sp.]|uniref:RagB/SusD family nutrient uptake outer membrane protein n=1 Tax=Proteiniphilum sp. TaxID=1926877 RepID=UPI00331EF59F